MRKFTGNKNIVYALGITLFVILWQILSSIIGKGTMILPSPFLAFSKMMELLGSSYTYKCIVESLIRMFLGFSIAFVLALVFGSLAGNFEFVELLLSPTITSIKTVPTASLVFLFIIISGARFAPTYIVAIIAFPILYEGIVGGIKNVDSNIVSASRVDGANIIKENLYIKLPLAIPYIRVAIASSLSLSFKIEIMSEVITGTTYPGLGSAISTVRRIEPANMVPVFAYSMIAVILFLIFDYLLNKIKQ